MKRDQSIFLYHHLYFLSSCIQQRAKRKFKLLFLHATHLEKKTWEGFSWIENNLRKKVSKNPFYFFAEILLSFSSKSWHKAEMKMKCCAIKVCFVKYTITTISRYKSIHELFSYVFSCKSHFTTYNILSTSFHATNKHPMSVWEIKILPFTATADSSAQTDWKVERCSARVYKATFQTVFFITFPGIPNTFLLFLKNTLFLYDDDNNNSKSTKKQVVFSTSFTIHLHKAHIVHKNNMNVSFFPRNSMALTATKLFGVTLVHSHRLKLTVT